MRSCPGSWVFVSLMLCSPAEQIASYEAGHTLACVELQQKARKLTEKTLEACQYRRSAPGQVSLGLLQAFLACRRKALMNLCSSMTFRELVPGGPRLRFATALGHTCF